MKEKSWSAPEKGSETILLVEDASALREVTREFLEGAGYRVLEAGGGDEALKIANEHNHPIPLLITDVVMHGASGHALAKQLKLARPRMEVLYVSGYADDEVFRHGVVPSGIAFLHKPYTQNELTTKVREMLDAAT